MLVKAIVPTEQVVDVICDVCGDFLELDFAFGHDLAPEPVNPIV